jgi:exonuclease SbcC
MELIALHLRNFRQHQEAHLEFQPGLTAIVGPNGSGKTSLLEAIAWALYGSRAIRGKVEDLRYSGAPARSVVEALLEFRLGSHTYQVVRRTDNAQIRVDGGAVSHTGTTQVNEAMKRLLGMDYRMFYTSFFTGQKELAFMANLEGPARAIAIGKMLGYERLSRARERANRQRLDLRAEAEALERVLGDGAEIAARRREARDALKAAQAAVAECEARAKQAQKVVAELTPQVAASRAQAERHRELTQSRERGVQEQTSHQARVEALREEIARLEKVEAQLAGLEPRVAQLAGLEAEFREQEKLRPQEARRLALQREASALQSEVEELRKQAAALGEPQSELDRERQDLKAALAEATELDQHSQKLRDEWVSRRESGQAEWRGLTEHRKEVAAHRQAIVDAGPGGKCPICERPLEQELPLVLGGFDAQLADMDRRMAEIRDLAAALKQEPAELVALRDRRAELEKDLAARRQSVTSLESSVQNLERLRREAAARAARLEQREKELAQLPSGFDEGRYKQLQAGLQELRPLAGQVEALGAQLRRLPDARKTLDSALDALTRLDEDLRATLTALEALAFDAVAHQALQERYQASDAELNTARLELATALGDRKAAQGAFDAAVAEENAHKERAAELSRLKTEHRYAEALATSFEALRTSLNSRIRPELEQTASELLSDLTDGRYSSLRVDEQYNYLLEDEGEPKPVISGGEEDVVSLALRLAISQMIADRAGQPLSLLVLDEVFGSLDAGRREKVVLLLNSLRARFEQIILISHIEAIHDAVDQAFWVSYDTKERVSRLLDHEPGGELELDLDGLGTEGTEGTEGA